VLDQEAKSLRMKNFCHLRCLTKSNIRIVYKVVERQRMTNAKIERGISENTIIR
jgi:hypothetical protein